MIHPVQLRNGNMWFVYNCQEISSEIIQKCCRSRTNRTAFNNSWIVFNSGAVSHFFNHFNIVFNSLLKPLRFQNFILAFKLCNSVFKLCPNHWNCFIFVFIICNIMNRRINHNRLRSFQYFSCKVINPDNFFNFVAKKINSRNNFLISRHDF